MARKHRRHRRTATVATAPMLIGARFTSLRTALLACSALCAVVFVPAKPARALPQGGQITAGSGQIIVNSPSEMTVVQNSNKLVIDWSSFNIAPGEKVVFVQADQLMQVLNRVLGAQASTIAGQLAAKGTVIITNPNGILFDAGSKVNVGAIIATTSGITDKNFLAGALKFDIPSTSGTASVINRGSITASEAGLVGLVAPGVENSGVIQARLGTIQMAAGNSFTVDLYGDKLIKLAVGDEVAQQVTGVDGSTLKALVANSGTLAADGGSVLITASAARDIVRNVINMDGAVQARSVGSANGEIVLDGGASGKVQVAGTLDASGTAAGETGGAIKLSGDDIAVVDGAKLLATGTDGGGKVAVGSWDSSAATLAAASTIDASATGSGKGGDVTVFAHKTVAAGTIKAEGGTAGGDGGFIETSGHDLNIDNIRVSAKSPLGKGGQWLLDPYDLTVGSSAAASISSALTNGSSVTLRTTASGTQGSGAANPNGNGDIVINSAISWNSSATLALNAYRSVFINAGILATTPTGGTGGLNVTYDGVNGQFLVGRNSPVTLLGDAGLTINSNAYQLVRDAAGLQALGTAGNFALAEDIDLTGITLAPKDFSGAFEGLGHRLSTLSMSSTSVGQGLFGTLSGSARNLSIEGGISAPTGGLLAVSNQGEITNVHAEGSIWGQGQVNGYYAPSQLGGLVGYNRGKITLSDADVGVATNNPSAQDMGGLVGINEGTINYSYATGAVNGPDGASGAARVGGLAGSNYSSGRIQSSFATGAVKGSNTVGGLVGMNSTASIDNSYATGKVSGAYYVGGLAGLNTQINTYYSGATIATSYATGEVSGWGYVGGLVGANDGPSSVNNSFAAGKVGLSGNALIGQMRAGSASSNYFDWQSTASTDSGCGGCATGLSTDQARARNGTQPGQAFSGWDFVNTWYQGADMYPVLRSSPFVVNVSADDKTMIYGASVPTLTGGTVTGTFWAGDSAARISGTAQFNTLATSVSDVGTYAITGSGLSATSVTGRNYIFAYAPAKVTVNRRDVTLVNVSADNKTYNGTTGTTITGATFSQLVNGDVLNITGDAAFADANAGTGKTVTVNNLTLTGAKAGNYTLTNGSVTTTADIAKRTLTVAGVTANDKTYDGTTAATIAGYGTTLADRVGSDDVGVSGSAAFADANAGTGKTVTIGLGLTGAKAGNYQLSTASTTASAAIARKMLALPGVTVADKYYDKTNAATIASYGALAGVIGGDDVTIGGGSAAFQTVWAEANKAVDVSGIALSGTKAGNYLLSSSSTTTQATISPRVLTVGTVTANDKTYDGTTAASIANYGTTLSNVLGTDDVSLGSSAVFSDANAGDGKSVSGSLWIAGGAAPNYALSSGTFATTANIAKRIVSLSGLTAQDKPYDGGVLAAISGYGSLSNLVSGDAVTASGGSAAFTDADAGIGKTVNVTGLTLSGAKAGNYQLATTAATAQASIARRMLTVAGVSADNKVYDGGTAATVAGYGSTLANKVVGDDVAVAGTSASFDTADAGTNKTVTVNGLTLSGAKAHNYQLSTTSTTTLADIAKRTLTVAGVSANDKIYDGDTAATIAGYGSTLANKVAGDDVAVGGSAAFTDADAGTGKTVTIAGLSLSGAKAANYQLSTTSTTAQADIAKRLLTVGGITVDNKTYDGTTAATIANYGTTLGNKVGSDAVSVGGVAAFADADAGTGKQVDISGLTLSGAKAANYQLSTTATTAQADIARRMLTVGGITVGNKTYDGTTAAAIASYGTTLGNVVGGDTVNISGTAAFADANVATGKAVSISGLALSGAKAANYQLSGTSAAATADIAKKLLSVTALDSSAVAGSPLPAVHLVYSGWVNGEGPSALSALPTVAPLGASAPGVYQLLPSGGAADNYAFDYRPGHLRIDAPPSPTVVASIDQQIRASVPATDRSATRSPAWDAANSFGARTDVAPIALSPELKQMFPGTSLAE